MQVAKAHQGGDSVRQLSNVLAIYNELVALRRLSVTLRRRCVFLENVQSLLRSQNSMLVDMVVEGRLKLTAYVYYGAALWSIYNKGSLRKLSSFYNKCI